MMCAKAQPKEGGAVVPPLPTEAEPCVGALAPTPIFCVFCDFSQFFLKVVDMVFRDNVGNPFIHGVEIGLDAHVSDTNNFQNLLTKAVKRVNILSIFVTM